MDSLSADLQAYYDQEAPQRAERGVGPDRTRYRDRFVELLRAEGRTVVLDVGCGPGRDTTALAGAGLTPVGIDLSFRNVSEGRRQGPGAYVQGSLYELPVRPGTAQALWSMSTLVHVPDSRIDSALDELCAAVEPGGLVGLGLWGGIDHEGVNDRDTIQPPRFFSHRTHDRLRAMMTARGTVEVMETLDVGLGLPWEYQFVILRLP